MENEIREAVLAMLDEECGDFTIPGFVAAWRSMYALLLMAAE